MPTIEEQVSDFARTMVREFRANEGMKGPLEDRTGDTLEERTYQTLYHGLKLCAAVAMGDAKAVDEFAADTANEALLTRLLVAGQIPMAEPSEEFDPEAPYDPMIGQFEYELLRDIGGDALDRIFAKAKELKEAKDNEPQHA